MAQKRFRRLKRTAAAALAAVLAFPASAFAEPATMEELNEIMEAQNEQSEEASLLEQMLGLEVLDEAMDDNGMTIQAQFGLPADTIQFLELEDQVQEGNYLKMHVQVDPNMKKWLFGLGLGAAEDDTVLDLALYGDKEQLALTLPQFFTGTVALGAGSLAEQYTGSVIEEMAGQLPAEADVNLDFYPEIDLDEAAGNGPMAGFEERLEERAEQLADSMTVEKNETDGQLIYDVTVPTREITGLYRDVITEYINILMSTGVVNTNDLTELEDELGKGIDAVELAMDDELVLHFYVQDDRVTKIEYSLSMDMNRVMELEDTLNAELDGETEAETEAAEPAYDPNKVANLDYVVTFRNPENMMEGMDIVVVGKDGTMAERALIEMSIVSEKTDTTSEMSMTMAVTEDGEKTYDGEIYHHYLNAETGECRAEINLQAEDGVINSLKLDGTFENVEKGKQFNLVIHELSSKQGEEGVSVNGNIFVSAEPGEFTAPSDAKLLFEMTQEEFINFMTEIQIKATTWAQRFQPETAETQESEFVVG